MGGAPAGSSNVSVAVLPVRAKSCRLNDSNQSVTTSGVSFVNSRPRLPSSICATVGQGGVCLGERVRSEATYVGGLVDAEAALVFRGCTKTLAHDCVTAEEDPEKRMERSGQSRVGPGRLGSRSRQPHSVLGKEEKTNREPFHAVRTCWRRLLRMCSTSKTQRYWNASACSRISSMSFPLASLPFLDVCVSATTRSRRERGIF